MTKSNNEWVPSVGDVIEVFDTVHNRWNKIEVTGVGREVFVIRYSSNAESLLSKKATIRPIKTEAEKRREKEVETLCCDLLNIEGISLTGSIAMIIGEALIDESWIKTKPVELSTELMNEIAWKILKETDYVDGIDKMVYVVRLVSKELRSKMIGAPE